MARLSYRPISLEDFEPYHEFLNDRACLRYLLHPEPHTRDETLRLLTRNVEAHDGAVGMYTLRDGDDVIGWAGYARRDALEPGAVELGWLLRRRFWGRGYATEAARHLRPLGPDRVLHLIHPENAASLAVASKLGARWERNVHAGAPAAVYVSPRSSPSRASGRRA